MRKLAQVYEHNNDWFFGSQSKTTTGLWITMPPLIELGRHDSRQQKGEAALGVVGASQEGVPLPEDTSSVVIPMLTKVGAKSWSAFMKKARCVGLEFENGKLRLMPYRPLPRSKGALEGITEQAMVLPANCAGPNCDRICCQINAVWIPA
jgi:hypothetical protein